MDLPAHAHQQNSLHTKANMRTKGLVGALAIALGLVGYGQAADPIAANNIEPQPAASVQPGCAAQSTCCAADSDSCGLDWHDFLIGSRCGYFLYAGTEFIAYDIDSQTGGRTTLSFSDTTAPGVSTVAFSDPGGVDDTGYAPRVWLGAQLTDKWGIRGRYWRLNDSDVHSPDPNPAIPSTGTNFATIFTTDRVEAWTGDIEVARNAAWGGWKGDAFLGGRHASYAADSDLLAFGVFTTGNFVNLTLQNSCSFNGDGATYGGSLRRQIGDSHFYAYGSVRGSQMWGESNSLGRADGTVASSPSAPLVGAATVTRNGSPATLDIIEFQVGLQFECPVQFMPASFFFRTAYEYQKWDIDGRPTGGAGFGGTIGEITTNSFASAGLGGMTLHGISIGTGLTW